MNLVIANRQRTRKINTRLLRQIADALFAELEITEAELGINLVGTHEMALVNETFLQHEGPTDVITFDYAGARATRPREVRTRTRGRDAGAPLHGELFICVDVALAQAKAFGTSWQSEVVRYLVHGVLHLLGHDDHHAAARRRMKQEENRRLARLSGKFSLAQIGGASKLRA
jgi:probable rRNA maturation factor